MIIKNILRSTFAQLCKSLLRFIWPLFYTLSIFAVFCFAVTNLDDGEAIFEIWMPALIFGFTLSVFVQLMIEQKRLHKVISLLQLLAFGGTLWAFYAYSSAPNLYLGWAGSIIILLSLILWLLVLAPTQSTQSSEEKHPLRNNSVFPYLISQAVIAAMLTAIVFLGLLVCVLAVNLMLWKFAELGHVILRLGVLSFCVFGINFFLSRIPNSGENVQVPAVFNVLIGKVLLPIYLLLIGILYAYLLKIVFTQTLPIGQINWFANLALLFFIIFQWCIGYAESNNRIAYIFMRFSGWFLLPILAVQALTVTIRVQAYGLTTLRYASILFSLAGLLFIIITLFKKQTLRILFFPILCVTAFIATLTPLNVIDFPLNSQLHQLVSLLEKNDMWQNGQIVSNGDTSLEDQIAITDKYYYLAYADKKSSWIEQYNTDTRFSDIFGFSPVYAYETEDTFDKRINRSYFNLSYEYSAVEIDQHQTLYPKVYGKDDDPIIDEHEKNQTYIFVAAQTYPVEIYPTLRRLQSEYAELNETQLREPLILSLSAQLDCHIQKIDFEVLPDIENSYRLFTVEGFCLKE